MINTEAHLQRIGNGDRSAFDELYRSWQPILVRYATGLLNGDRESAEDVTDEALLAVWQQASRFAGSGSGAGWMRRIVRNKSVDLLRRRHPKDMSIDGMEGAASYLPDPCPNADEVAEKQSEKVLLTKALGLLSVDHREVVWLCYFEELSIREIADIVGCPSNTIKTRLFHARQILRKNHILKSALSDVT